MALQSTPGAQLPRTLLAWQAPVRAVLGTAGLAVLLAASVVLAIDAAAAPSLLVPAGHHTFPGWLAGPLAGLGERTTADGLGILLVAMLAGWLLALAGAAALPRRLVVGAIVAAHVVFLLAPPLLSADVFGYVAFARMGVVHHLDPYVFGTGWAPHDAVHPFLRWHNAHSPYGPLFTLLSYGVAPLGVAGAFWSFKVLAFAASLGTVALVWRTAERLGRDPRPAAVLVGLSPAVLAFEVAGGHNDVLAGVIATAGVALVVAHRDAVGTAALTAAGALKLSGGIAAPFALVAARDRRSAAFGAALAGGTVAALAVAGFGRDAGRSLTTAATAGGGIATFSIPSTVARLTGDGSVSPTAQTALLAVAVACLAGMLWRAARSADWISCAGWSTLALLCCTTWLVPWYATWLTPLAALGESRRLRLATVALAAYLTLTRVRFVTP